MNLFENLWALLKQQLRKRFFIKKYHQYNASELFTAPQRKWEKIDQDIIDELIDSIPSRIQAMINS